MSYPPLAIVILAAGKGTRMKSDQPKVMHALAGKPMINWLLDTVEGLKPTKIITVIGPDMPDLADAAGAHETIIQQERNGTGGAIAAAMPALEGFAGDILVLLGDTPLIEPDSLHALIAARHASEHTKIAVLGTYLDNPTGYGRLITQADNSLLAIVEEKDADAATRAVNLVNTGALCFDSALLPGWLGQLSSDNAAGELYATDIPAIAAEDGHVTRIAIAPNPARVMGCNTPADLARLEAEAQEVLRNQALLNGVKMIDPSTVYLQHDTEIAPGTLIEPNLFCGPGVAIGPGCHIKAFCHLEGASIGAGSIVGPFARLRPGSDLADEVRIGNFVEVKKSAIGARSKISHLGYVGDTVMGEDVNFSAGAITVNYDGFEKHQTHIGRGVMVGSNVNLVAPIAIDDGAFIAAGSTITEDVPSDALSITRDAAKVREGWAAEYRKRKAAIVKTLKGN